MLFKVSRFAPQIHYRVGIRHALVLDTKRRNGCLATGIHQIMGDFMAKLVKILRRANDVRLRLMAGVDEVGIGFPFAKCRKCVPIRLR